MHLADLGRPHFSGGDTKVPISRECFLLQHREIRKDHINGLKRERTGAGSDLYRM